MSTMSRCELTTPGGRHWALPAWPWWPGAARRRCRAEDQHQHCHPDRGFVRHESHPLALQVAFRHCDVEHAGEGVTASCSRIGGCGLAIAVSVCGFRLQPEGWVKRANLLDGRMLPAEAGSPRSSFTGSSAGCLSRLECDGDAIVGRQFRPVTIPGRRCPRRLQRRAAIVCEIAADAVDGVAV